MKLAGVVCAMVLSVPVSALAEPSASFQGEVEYVIPVEKPNLKPFSKFFVSRFNVEKDEDGSFNVRLTLPRDLTGGRTIEVDLVQTERQGNKIRFTKDLGDATCDVPGDWSTAKCTYVFNQNFRDQVPVEEASAYLSKKYKGDPTLNARKEVVIDNFLKSTESIGEALPKPFSASCQACVLGNGVWDAQYTTEGGQVIPHELSLARREGRYFHEVGGGGSGTLTGIQYAGRVATGTWKFGGSQGWFRFEFESEGLDFSGQWGYGAVGNQPKGTWSGTRVGD